ERNILLQDSRWPRETMFELIRFRGSKNDPDEMRVSAEDAKADIWVRVHEWVIADEDAPGGWRPLRWRDLEYGKVPDVNRVVTGLPDDWEGWTVDADAAGVDLPAELVRDIENWDRKSISAARADLNRGTRAPELLGITLPPPPSIRKQLRQA